MYCILSFRARGPGSCVELRGWRDRLAGFRRIGRGRPLWRRSCTDTAPCCHVRDVVVWRRSSLARVARLDRIVAAEFSE